MDIRTRIQDVRNTSNMGSTLHTEERHHLGAVMAGSQARIAVHPGWLMPDIAPAIDETEDDDVLRFGAFMQLLRTAGALDRAATDALADLDLTAGAFGALVELGIVGDAGIAPSELARRLAVARRTATLYVDILARHGWAEREAHPEDRRMVLARLTEAGRTMLKDHGDAYKQRLASLLGEITPLQAERLRQLLALVPTDGSIVVTPSEN
jgi:DNA-binding MarR family transcriptional regulator